MRKEDFFEILGELDDDILKNVKLPVKKKWNWKIWGPIAACLALACALTVYFIPANHDDEMTSQSAADIVPMVYVNDTLYIQSSDQRGYPERKDEFIIEVTSPNRKRQFLDPVSHRPFTIYYIHDKNSLL